MANVPSIAKKIQTEEIQFRAPSSESTMQKISGSINFLLDSGSHTAIGEILKSILTEAQFQSILGVGWILCDGRSVVGSQFQTITGMSTVPNIMGRFSRGKNYVRPSAGDTSGDLAHGAAIGDTIGNHTHSASRTNPNEAVRYLRGGSDDRFALICGTYGFFTFPCDAVQVRRVGPLMNAVLLDAGSVESRPSNITINWFVRIN